MNEEDKELIKELYGLDDKEMLQADILYARSCFSPRESAEIVKGRRETNFVPKPTHPTTSTKWMW